VTDAQGRVTGVSFFKIENGAVQHRTVRARRVILSSGAIESPRLLLNSASSAHPNGLGNRFDQVGRNLQGHIYTGAFGLFSEETEESNGPGVSLSTCEFSHDNPGIIGGGMLCNEFVKLPIIFWRTTLPPDLPRWGRVNKQHMRDYYRRTMQIYGPIQEIPTPEARVTVDAQVKDRFGLPVARLSGLAHLESLRTADFLRARAEDWLRACGAERVWSYPNRRGLTGGQHQAGTCRMGNDPQTSITDPWGRVHGHDNLFVVDGSLHVTNGGFNPVLTIMALAFRCAGHIAATL
jgi:choline dehydrogenase-like flavoprotein